MAKYSKKTSSPIVEETKEPITETILEVEEELKPISKTKKINTYRLNVRTAPSLKATIKREIEKDAEVTPLGEEGDWTKIGEDEWVMTKYLK